MLDIINKYNDAFQSNLISEKRNIFSNLTRPPGQNTLNQISIVSGSKRDMLSYLGEDSSKIYEINLLIKKKEYKFFKKVMQNPLNENESELIISRWRYMNKDLEMPINHFFYTILNLPKKDADFCEEYIENFPFIKMINQIERKIKDEL